MKEGECLAKGNLRSENSIAELPIVYGLVFYLFCFFCHIIMFSSLENLFHWGKLVNPER
jgi:hypothetical protein